MTPASNEQGKRRPRHGAKHRRRASALTAGSGRFLSSKVIQESSIRTNFRRPEAPRLMETADLRQLN